MGKFVPSIALFLCLTNMAYAEYFLVNDMSLIKYEMGPDGRVYFRNLNEYDARFQGCCYNYYLDTDTSGGKVIWSTIMTTMAMKQPLYMHGSPAATPSKITHISKYQ